MKVVSETVREVFDGDIDRFLDEESPILGGVYDLLDQQFGRLSKLEQEVMYWLAIEREAVSPGELYEDIVHPASRQRMVDALGSLRQRSLVEKNVDGFTLQNVIMEYVTDRLVDRVCTEITTKTASTLQSHALINAGGDILDFLNQRKVSKNPKGFR